MGIVHIVIIGEMKRKVSNEISYYFNRKRGYANTEKEGMRADGESVDKNSRKMLQKWNRNELRECKQRHLRFPYRLQVKARRSFFSLDCRNKLAISNSMELKHNILHTGWVFSISLDSSEI